MADIQSLVDSFPKAAGLSPAMETIFRGILSEAQASEGEIHIISRERVRREAVHEFVMWLAETGRIISGPGTMQAQYHPSMPDERAAMLADFEEHRNA